MRAVTSYTPRREPTFEGMAVEVNQIQRHHSQLDLQAHFSSALHAQTAGRKAQTLLKVGKVRLNRGRPIRGTLLGRQPDRSLTRPHIASDSLTCTVSMISLPDGVTCDTGGCR